MPGVEESNSYPPYRYSARINSEEWLTNRGILWAMSDRDALDLVMTFVRQDSKTLDSIREGKVRNNFLRVVRE